MVCAGGKNFTGSEIRIFQKLNITDRIFQYSVTDNNLAYLYQRALCFVFPSLYEGFGIPVLEAFACSPLRWVTLRGESPCRCNCLFDILAIPDFCER